MTKSRDLANAATALNAVTAAELTYVDGVTSAIQTQLDSKAPSSTAVTLTGTQTLTNKTLTNPVIASVVNNTLTTAKGDLVTATAASTPAALAVGNNGETLVADSSTSTGLRYTANFAAGKNKIINGDFGVWQRGTSTTVTGTYGAQIAPDRYVSSSIGGSTVCSQQTFTPGTAPVAGYEGQYFLRLAPGSGVSYVDLGQKIEDVRTFAGQTVTVSFWAKATSTVNIQPLVNQFFGSGGSGAVNTYGPSTITLTTSWTRYTQTVSFPSVSGKTIGASSGVAMYLVYTSGTLVSNNIDFWGMQVEAGSVATAFQTATGTIQGELAACQRYYQRFGGDALYQILGFGNARSTQITDASVPFNVAMRVVPTSVDFSTLATIPNYGSGAVTSVAALSLNSGGNSKYAGQVVATSSGTPFTANSPYYLSANNSTSAFLGFSAEL